MNNYKDGYQLDKDLLKPDCGIYSPDTCLFVPRAVNSAEAMLRALTKIDPEYSPVLEIFRKKAIRQAML